MNTLKKFFRNDKVLFVFSLLAAIVLWMMVVSERNPETTSYMRDVAVECTGTEAMEAKGLHIISQSDSAANIKFAGRFSEVYNVALRDVSVTADLSGITEPGAYEVPLSGIISRTGVSLESISPAVISLNVDYMDKKRCAVEIVLDEGALPEGYVAGTPVSNTKTITVDGPKNLLNRIEKAVAVVDLSGVKQAVSKGYMLELWDKAGNRITDSSLKMSTTEVWVDIPVYAAKAVPVQVTLNGEANLEQLGLRIAVEPASVEIRGEESAMRAVEFIKTEALDELSAGAVTAKLIIPDGVYCDIQEVTVLITEE